ncbi:hypothetical protein O3G_MSEX004262 [Manduca sexta]|uniref:RRM domain-containing protein n=1 Tax=Manduca sexta TaxID=7130 RepID=A0A922CH82_MANSE|nr:hypothetical protein O3G_MSEX004262 [Manduca sexta]
MPKCKPNVEKSKDEAEDSNVEKGRIPVRIGRRKRIGHMNKMLPKNGNDDMHNLSDIFQKMLKFYMTPVNQQPAKPPATKPLTLFVSNIPTAWSYDEVKQFIEKECGSIQEVELMKSQGPVGTVKVKFFTHIQLIIAKHELVEKEIDGRKLTVDDEKVEGESNVVHPPPRYVVMLYLFYFLF